jgi:methylthioribose-1-phosphate isomerase
VAFESTLGFDRDDPVGVNQEFGVHVKFGISLGQHPTISENLSGPKTGPGRQPDQGAPMQEVSPESLQLDTVSADDAILWRNDGLYLLDQRRLPGREVFIACPDARTTAGAIAAMVVRGAPAIGITAAYGIALAARARFAERGADWRDLIEVDLDILAASRPTAVNLFWAIERLRRLIDALDAGDPVERLLAEARAIHTRDRADNRRMGEFGAGLIDPIEGRPGSVITHCNTGGLATGGWGTALGVIRSAFAAGRLERVYADETRPWLQGARLTAWELVRDGIPVSLIADGAAAARMAAGGVSWAIVGADRIAANGDVANKIGTYALAVAARHHGVRFMVAAPTSTIDLATPDGAAIPIEERPAEELLRCAGRRTTAEGVEAWNPVFDVTPAELVDAIVTERGVIRNPSAEKIAEHMG